MIPSEFFLEPGTLALNAGREKRTLKVDRTLTRRTYQPNAIHV
jgi:hypothetical protein